MGSSFGYQYQYYQQEPQQQEQESYYMRRLSYTDMLSQSEASLSDGEQQETPSPMIDYYEDKTLVSCGGVGLDYASSCFYQPFHNNMINEMYLSPSHLLYTNEATTTAYHYPIQQQQQQQTLEFYSSPLSSFGSCDVPSPSPSPSFTSLSSSSLPSCATPTTTIDSATTTTAKVVKKKQSKRSCSASTSTRVRKEPSHATSTAAAAVLKSFECTERGCRKVFKRSEHLKRHVRSIHTKEKPFECPYQACCKRFSRSDNLNQHIRIHRPSDKISKMQRKRNQRQ